MKIDLIKSIVNSNMPIEYQKQSICSIIGNDDDSIGIIFEIIKERTRQDKELIIDTNLELSRALVYVDNPKSIKRDFVKGEIHKHYLKWKDTIKCCFKFKELP